MQWGIDGRPNWSAPKWIALGFGPGIGVFAMATMLVRCRHDPDGRREFRTLLPMSAILIGGHVFYLSMLWTKGIAQPG